MKLATKFLCILLIVCLLVTGTVIVSAKQDELYLEDIRIVYADSYEEAQKILQNTEFKDYALLDYNLNATAAKIDLGVSLFKSEGVFLAYKTTTNVDDAITDVAIMQMDGGYRMGNYLEMVKKSREHYEEVGETYLTAIEYMINAYYAGDFRATAAFRQLELYKDGERKDGDSGLTLGALFETQPGADTLAKMFLEGNTYVIKNIRALIGMGVSYNDDGMTYLEKVTEAAEMDADEAVFDEEGYEDLAETLSNSIVTFREMLKTLSYVEDDLNFEDDELTDTELQYAEHAALAAMFRATDYLDGKTLYDFCLAYQKDDSDFSSLYPLVHALNDGQKAIATAGNYYDAIRYSMSEMPEEFMHEEICKLEEAYANDPFNVYAGVDRSIYKSSYALTSDAYRADVSNDRGFFESVYGAGDWRQRAVELTSGAVGAGLFVWAIVRTKDWVSTDTAARASELAYIAAGKARVGLEKSLFAYTNTELVIREGTHTLTTTPAKFIDEIHQIFVDPYMPLDTAAIDPTQNLFVAKVNYAKGFTGQMPASVKNALNEIADKTDDLINQNYANAGYDYGQPLPDKLAATTIGSKLFTVGLYAVGAIMMAYSAYSYGSAVVSYYNPEYSDIPAAMIDLVVTEDGDRYIKYNAATQVTMNDKTKEYDPADLNAFEGQRWNALYFTKSYEAGKPLLASPASFKVVTNSNVAPAKHLPVHRFGESVCYNLNKHNFVFEENIYLSIAQSDEQKSFISDVPNIVGSMISSGLYFLTAGLGMAGGVAITVVTQKFGKKKETDVEEETASK